VFWHYVGGAAGWETTQSLASRLSPGMWW
jgi:hypothetical protein